MINSPYRRVQSRLREWERFECMEPILFSIAVGTRDKLVDINSGSVITFVRPESREQFLREFRRRQRAGAFDRSVACRP